MKCRPLVIALLVFAVALSSGASLARPAVTEAATLEGNLVANYGFEELPKEPGVAPSWLPRVYEGSLEFVHDTEMVESGRQSLKFAAKGARGTVQQKIGPLDASAVYRLRAAYRSEGISDPDAIRIRLTFYGEGGTKVLNDITGHDGIRIVSSRQDETYDGTAFYHVVANKLGADDWEEMELVFVPPAGVDAVRIDLFVWRSTGTVWWDDIVVQKLRDYELEGTYPVVDPRSEGVSSAKDLNLVLNGRFEDRPTASGSPPSWVPRVYQGSVEFAHDTETVKSGKQSLRFVADNARGVVQQQVGPIQDDATYRLTAAYRSEGISDPDAIQIRLAFYGESGSTLLCDITGNTGLRVISSEQDGFYDGATFYHIVANKLGADDWDELELVFTPPEGADAIRVDLFVWYSTGTVWWDDVAVKELREFPSKDASPVVDSRLENGPATVTAKSSPLTVTVQFEPGQSLVPSYDLINLDGAEPDKGHVLALTWAPASVGWFGTVWGIQIISDMDVLPPDIATPGSGALVGTSMFNTMHAAPEPGHRYEAMLSYDPSSGATAVRVVDLTMNRAVVEVGAQLRPYRGPITVGTTTFTPDTQEVREGFAPLGMEWRLVQFADTGKQRAADPVDRRQPVLVSTRVPWASVAGGLRLSLIPLDSVTNAAAIDMGTVPISDKGMHPVSFEDVVSGPYEARMEYISEDGALVMPLGSTPIRVGLVTAKVEAARATLLDDSQVEWRGDLVVSADGPVPDVTVHVGAVLDKWVLDTSSPVNHWTIGTARDGEVTALTHSFSMLDQQVQRLPIEAQLPISLGVEWPYRLWDAGLQVEVTSVAGSETVGFLTPVRVYAAEQPEPGPVLRVMSYNIHIGIGMDGRNDLQRIADVIALADADIVGLQEVDVGVRRTGGVDQVKVLAELLNMEAIHGPARAHQGGQYGNAILSRYPITRSQNTLLPSMGNEPRGQLEAIIDIGGTPLWFTVTHLSLIEEENVWQQRFLVERLQSVKEPFVLLGDFNMRAGSHKDPRATLDPSVRDAWLVAMEISGPQTRLRIADAAGFTFNSANPSRRIDYVFLSDELELPHAQAVFTIDTEASDHLPLVAEIMWPPPAT